MNKLIVFLMLVSCLVSAKVFAEEDYSPPIMVDRNTFLATMSASPQLLCQPASLVALATDFESCLNMAPAAILQCEAELADTLPAEVELTSAGVSAMSLPFADCTFRTLRQYFQVN